MNCAVCNHPIDRSGGYYLMGDGPYCNSCFQGAGRHRGAQHPTQPPAIEWEHDDLLEAFRAYQERERESAY